MLGPPKMRDLDRPVLISVESIVPNDHLYRHLRRALDLSRVRDLVAAMHPFAIPCVHVIAPPPCQPDPRRGLV